MMHDRQMTDFHRSGPDPETIVKHILEQFPDTDVVAMPGAWFFSLDPEKHWPNYATLVTTEEFDAAPNLLPPGAFRLSLGLDRATFERVTAHTKDLDAMTLDRLVPHPVYGAQRWVCVLNPSARLFEAEAAPLIAIAHHRLAAQRARHPARP